MKESADTDDFIPTPRVFGLPICEQATAKRIQAIARSASGVSSEKLEAAQAARALVVQAQERDTHLQLERFNQRLLALSPDARACVRDSIRDAILERLGDDPNDGWRRRRFLEALEGKRVPYVVERDAGILAPTGLREQVGNDQVVHKGYTALQVLEGKLAVVRCGTVHIGSVKVAEDVAAHYEQQGYVAMLRRLASGVVLVHVYEEKAPPSRDPGDGLR